jgi:uncharacterized coiled-coil protein SlyX
MHTNIIDARPHTPTSLFALENLITHPDPREERIHALEAKLAQIETQLKELQKIATAVDMVYELEARIKSLQAFVAELYSAVKQPPSPPKPEPPPPPQEKPPETKTPDSNPPPAENKADTPAPSDIERMVLRVLYRKLEYWLGRANLKVDEKGYTVIGRDVNFGVKFSQFVAIMTRFGLSEWVIARGNDRAGYYVEIKASDMPNTLQHLKTLDETLKGALSRP